MQRREHSRRDQGAGPDHAAGSYQVSSRKSGKGVSKNLSGEDEQDLIHDTQILVIELHLLNDNLNTGQQV
jgi:hypothetical protein